MTRTILGGLLAATCATGALAQGFSGAELSVEAGAMTDDFDVGHTVYSGSAELAFTPSISVAAGFTHLGYRGLDTAGTGYAAHGMYRMGSGLTAGLFLGRDDMDGTAVDFAGIEGATSLASADVQGYLGQYTGDAGDGTMIGIAGAFALNDQFGFEGSLDSVSGDQDFTRIAVGGSYQFGNGPQVFAEVGTLNDDSGSDGTFITLGARIGIGPQGGTTFGDRGILQALGGF